MTAQRLLAGLLTLGLTCGLVGISPATFAQEKDKKKEKNPLEGKKGTAVGTLTDKGPNFIELRADGEEKGRRYVPHWVGGAPAQGGGPDKKMLKVFSELKVGSRLEVQWEFEERLRAVNVKVLKEPKGASDDKKIEEKRVGKTLGTLQSRTDDRWIEVLGDGEEKARKYFFHAKMPDKLLVNVRQVPIGSRVSVDWLFTNHGPMVQNIEVLAKPRDK